MERTLREAWVPNPGAIQVAVATDDGYASHLTVMLLSLFERGGQQPIHVHALIPVGFKSTEKMRTSLGSFSNQITFHQIDSSAVENLKQRQDITNATYYRLLMGELLPKALERVIYLDCDMLICGELSTLWETSLEDAVIAAVSDSGFTQHDVLGFAPSEPYFNAGMLLVDLNRWREADIGKKALDFAASNPERLSFNDQCALNWVLRSRWAHLPAVWNLQSSMLGDFRKGYFTYPQSLRKNADGVRIVHFNDPGRPWFYLDEHPFKSQYLKFRARTPWANDNLVGRYPHNILVKALRRRAPFLLPAYLHLRKFV